MLRLLWNAYTKYLPAEHTEAVHFCSGMNGGAPRGLAGSSCKRFRGTVRDYFLGGPASILGRVGLSTPSLPRAAILPAAEALPLRIDSNPTPIRAPTKPRTSHGSLRNQATPFSCRLATVHSLGVDIVVFEIQERSIGNMARMVITVAEHPCFTDGTIAGQRCGEQVSQTTAAPEPILINWLESQGGTQVVDSEIISLLLCALLDPVSPIGVCV